MLRRSFTRLCGTTTGSSSALATTKQHLESRITKLGDEVVRPVDYFGIFSKSTYTTPMVILLGNHSSGKSTFVNSLLGQSEQETGLAPTDDGFTVIVRGDVNVDEQGPTALANPANGFTELQEFGTNFQNHFRLKIRKLPEGAKLPHGMMIVDTPGMIDTPPDKNRKSSGGDSNGGEEGSAHSIEAQSRGYDFLRVTKWFAQRADTILLMFDPNNPGTTGETLMVLTNSLVGHEHKFKIVLNKSDMFKNVTDYARAYGTLAWNLSKVIQVSKDIPPIFSAYTRTQGQDEKYTGAVPEKEMVRARRELTKVVLSAPLYRLDNLMTEMEEAARRVVVAATVVRKVQTKHTKKKMFNAACIGGCILGFPSLMAAVVIPTGHIVGIALGVLVSAGGIGGSAMYFGNDLKSYERNTLINGLDQIYEECFPQDQTMEETQRWAAVKKLIRHRCDKQGLAGLPTVGVWSGERVRKMLKHEVPQLRKEIRAYKEEAAKEQERCFAVEEEKGKN